MVWTAIACKQQTLAANRLADNLLLARCVRSSMSECIHLRERWRVSKTAL